MHAIARLVDLDLRSIRSNAKYMIIVVALMVSSVLFVIVTGLLVAEWNDLQSRPIPSVSIGPYLLIPSLSGLAAANAPNYLFGTDARGRLDTLYSALGIKRRQVVAGRYLTCLLLLIALTVAGVALARVIALAFGIAFDWGIAAAFAAGAVAAFGTVLAAQLPAFFATGPGAARNVAYAGGVTVLSGVVAAAILGVSLGDPSLESWLGATSPAWLALAAIAMLGVLGAVSFALSARLYARRDL